MTSSTVSEQALPGDHPHIRLRGVGMRFRTQIDTAPTLKRLAADALHRRHRPRTIDRWLYRDLDLDLAHGEQVGIIGRNGAGKSTLVRLIAGVYQPLRGRVTVAGTVAPLFDLGTGFKPTLSAKENIVLNGVTLGRSRREMQAKVDEILAFSELEAFRFVPVKHFSSGMVQRLAFTIATDIGPDVLLVDEVFAGGDIGFVAKAKARMQRIIDQARILVVVSHNMDLIRELTSRILWIEDGRVVMDGPTDLVARAYEAWLGVGTVPSRPAPIQTLQTSPLERTDLAWAY